MKRYEQCAEMLAFKDLLDSKGITWHSQNDMVTGLFRVKGKLRGNGRWTKFSVIWGRGTYGEEDGLLEVMVNSSEPVGYLTAEEALQEIERHL